MQDPIKKYQFKDGLPLEFEIVDLEKILLIKKDIMCVPHRAQFYHVMFLEKAAGTHYIDFKPIELEDHSLIFIPLNSINKFDPNGRYEGKAIIFTRHFFCRNEDDIRFLHSSILFNNLYGITPVKFSPHASELRVFIDSMLSEFKRQPDIEQYPILQNMLHIFLLMAERKIRKQGATIMKSSPALDDLLHFREILENDFIREKSVKGYALKMGISEKQLHKATTSLLDKTPKQIIDERVLLEAKRLLVHGNQSIKEIAYELGYDEPTNFIKYFRKHSGITPTDFRGKY